MSRAALVVSLSAAVLALAGACARDDTAAPPVTSTTQPTVTVDWNDPSLAADLGSGWTARQCEGDDPTLCIERHGEAKGVVEIFDFPAGDGVTLDARVAELYAATAEDRERGCPAGYEFETVPPASTRTAGFLAVRYGSTGLVADGRPSERTLAYMIEREGSVTVVQVAGYEPDGCLPPEGPAFRVGDVVDFTPAFERLVAGSRLPAAAGQP